MLQWRRKHATFAVWAVRELPPRWSYEKRLIQRVHSKLLTQRCSGVASSFPALPHANPGQISFVWLTGACIASRSGHSQILAGVEQPLPLPVPCKACLPNTRLLGVAGVFAEFCAPQTPLPTETLCSAGLRCKWKAGRKFTWPWSWWVQIKVFHLSCSTSGHGLSYTLGEATPEVVSLHQLGALEDPCASWNTAAARWIKAKFFRSPETENTLA